nr:MAG TPA: hypothetical protein [Microviridae sp.]
MIQLHITMIPSITKYGKFRKKEWAKSAKIPFESYDSITHHNDTIDNEVREIP